jgi:glycosyltransferase involved in cell wall biosynthesis
VAALDERTTARLRTLLRPAAAAALWPFVKPFRTRIERTQDGDRLEPGITAVVAVRDEDYSVGWALRSLVGFVDEIVVIDNGSTDGTIDELETFRRERGHDVAVEIVSMPGALLGDCRDEGLRRTRRQWHLRWDGDMIARREGPASILPIREQVLHDSRPRTIQIARTNLIGDLRHMPRLAPVVDIGESWLMRFGPGIKYREIGGTYDVVRPPLYYSHEVAPGSPIFHLAGLKSDENLLHRFNYFAWRQTVNRDGDALDPELRTLDGFTNRRNEELFGTNDPRSVKFRYGRQLSYHFAPYDPERYGGYPAVLHAELSKHEPRFEVLYRDGRPWIRVDRADEQMAGYEPTDEDLAWDPEAFLRRFLSDAELATLGISGGAPHALASTPR